MGPKRKHSAKGPHDPPQPAQKRLKPNPLLADRRPFVNDMKPEDHLRERDLYKLLGSVDFEDRLRAGLVIIVCLLGSGSEDKGAVDEVVLHRHLSRRLFRGLASGSDAARVGFSYVLVEVIRQLVGEKNLAESNYPGLGFNILLEMLIEKTKPVGNVPGREERDHYWGRLFGLLCFVQAGVLFNNEARWTAVLEHLVKLARKKAWLQPQCGFVITQAIPQMKRELVEKTFAQLTDSGMAMTAEGFGVWLAAQDAFPNMKLPKPWEEPLSTKSFQTIAAVLKGSMEDVAEEDSNAAKPSMTMTQLHFVWDLILARFMRGDKQVKDFRSFWDRVVDQTFFSKTASDKQKLSGFKVFQKVLETCHSSPTMIQAIFSQHLMGCLMNQAVIKERYLNRAAIKALGAVEGTVERHPELLLTVLPRLLGEHGVYNFDQRTNTKTVDKLLRFTRREDGAAILALLKGLVRATKDRCVVIAHSTSAPIADTTTKSDTAEKHIRIYGDYISKLASAGTDPKDMDQQGQGSVSDLALQELAKLAYSGLGSGLTEKTRSTLRVGLTSAFAKVIRRPQGVSHMCNAILAVKADAIDMDDEIEAELADALERLSTLTKTDNSADGERLQAARQGLALLHAIAILQLYNEKPDAMEALGDTKQCYVKLQEDGTGEEDESELSEILVETLLAMVAQPCSLMRQASLLVFEAFTSFMSAKALEFLTDPLAVEENEHGQKALFDNADEEMGEDEDEEDDADEDGMSDVDSDVEFIGMADGDDGDDASENETEGEGEEDDESDDALAAILGTHRLDKDKDADSSDDADMTDSEMMAMDEKMAEYFKHRIKSNNKQKEKKEAIETVIVFKHRVLDFLDVYMKNEAPTNNPLIYSLLLPLLQEIRTTRVKALSAKACAIVADFAKYRKKKPRGASTSGVAEVDVYALMTLLNEIHAEAPKDPSHAHTKAVSTASLAIASTLYKADAKIYDKVARVYAKTQKAATGGAVIPKSFFADWDNWRQSHGKKG